MLKLALLNGVALGQAISDYQMITLFKLPWTPLTKTSFGMREFLNIERECSEIVLTKPLSLFQLGSCFHNTVYLVTFHPQFLLDMQF
jgi:hypothetical protein